MCRRRLELENRVETESENIEKRKREKAEVRLMRKRAAQQFSVDRLKMKEKAMRELGTNPLQLIRPIGAEGLNRRPPAGACRLFLGPGFRLGARWNRLGQAVKTRKKRGKRGENGRDTA